MRVGTVTFSTVILASETSLGDRQPKEEIKFNFATFTTTTPGPLPISFALLISASAGLRFLHRRSLGLSGNLQQREISLPTLAPASFQSAKFIAALRLTRFQLLTITCPIR